jgi:hypothetical protein
MKSPRLLLGTAIAAVMAAGIAGAHPLSRQECTEGSDFIRNAAHSRDNGMDGMTFLNRAIEDMATIKAFPPSLRWFVQDQSDEDYLLAAVSRVFSSPTEPRTHQSDFFTDCMKRAAVDE